MNARPPLLPILALAASLGAATAARGQTPVFTQAMMPGGGTLRTSSYWVDPTGENDLDSDSQAWEDFTLTQTATVTRVRWWGQAMPPLGFNVSFHHQDPNTVAVQPDIFAAGSEPISEESFPTPAAQSAGGGLYEFTVDLATPVTFEGGTRYFVSVVGLTPVPFATWSWAQGEGAGTTFWWSRGMHMYFQIAGNRALELSGEACTGDVDGSGSVNVDDMVAVILAWGTADPAADVTQDGVVNVDDLVEVFVRWGACP
jgi:hypothetical protein